MKNEIYAQKRHSKNRLQQQQQELVEKNPKNGKNRLISHLEWSNQQKMFQQIPKHMLTWYETMESANLFLFSEKKIQYKNQLMIKNKSIQKKLKDASFRVEGGKNKIIASLGDGITQVTATFKQLNEPLNILLNQQ